MRRWAYVSLLFLVACTPAVADSEADTAVSDLSLQPGEAVNVLCPDAKLTISVRATHSVTVKCGTTVSPSPSPSASPSPSPPPSPSPSPSPPPSPSPSPTGSAPPDPGGYFTLQPVGAWSSLPSGATCAGRVHRSSWEPRPTNVEENHTLPNAQAMHASFAARVRSADNTYNTLWDSWLLPRVDGQFTGTTDEIFQWAACKWGLPDNAIRADAVRESTWFQYLHFTDGQCFWNRGCGDAFATGPTVDTGIYCGGIALFGHDYQTDTNSQTYGRYPYTTPQQGMCPKTYSILGIMSWENPTWVAPSPPWPGNQNGTFPFTRDSTAAAADYWGGYIRGCYEGWIKWLAPAGDLWGCIGSWYSGDWHSTAANDYIGRVQGELTNLTWLTSGFAAANYNCDPLKGCPV
jgi:hypothetical protein